MNYLKKNNYIWNTIGTGFVSFMSLFLLIIVTRINGINQAGIFTFSFSSACIVNIFALYCGRTYQVTDDNSQISESTFVITRYITGLTGMLIALLFALINHYSIDKFLVFILLCVLKCFEAISDVYYGINQKRDHLYIAGKSMTYRTIISITVFFVIDYFTKNLIISCLMLVIIAVIFLLFYDIKNAKKESKIIFSFNKDEIFKLLKNSSYTCFFTLIVMVCINIPKYAIDVYSTNDIQAMYGIISMPATFIMLFGQFILQPSLMQLSNAFNNNKMHEFNKIIIKLSGVIFGFLIIILPFVYIFGIPILNLIYSVNLCEYKWFLIIIVIGAAFYTISQIILNSLITLRCTKEQLYLQIVTLVIAVIISIFLVKNFGLFGSILSYFLILLLQFIFYIILYVYYYKKVLNTIND